MRTAEIDRVVDALASQQRMIVWFKGCHHKLSITQVQLATMRPGEFDDIIRGGKIDCPFCLDPPPVVEQERKSANQLWKEAGEP